MSICGTGGTSGLAIFPVLKAFFIEANDDFREGVDAVAVDGVGPCPEELDFVAENDKADLVWPNDECSDVNESPRVWNESAGDPDGS